MHTEELTVGGVMVLCFRTAGAVFGEGFRAFISDWDKVTATVKTHTHKHIHKHKIP